MRAFAILGDFVLCLCMCKGGRCPDGQIVEASPDTFIESRPAARMGDTTTNCCGSCCKCPNTIVTGSPDTFINGRPAARVTDTVTCGLILVSQNATTFN